MGAAATALLWLLSQEDPNTSPPCIIVLAAYSSNGEQVVTFRTDPTNAQVRWTDLVPASYDGTTQPRTTRQSGDVFPVRTGSETNFTLHYVAYPQPGLIVGGKPLAYTPGSYTVAYTPSGGVHRVRIGVAVERSGIRDFLERLRACQRYQSLRALGWKSYWDPWFVTTEVFTNAAPVGAKP